MKAGKIRISLLLMLFMPLWIYSQTESVDLTMVYRIKQEGSRNSKIEELAFGLTDFVGPRLTASTGNTLANEWAKKKMEELGFQNIRIEEVADFSRGGWNNLKTYAATTAPYYTNFAGMMAQRQLRTKVTEMLKSEGAAVILNNSGSYNIPNSRAGDYTTGSKEPVA